MIITGICKLNPRMEDPKATWAKEYQEEKWPEFFVAVPRCGERVESLSGKCVLNVHSVIHTMLYLKIPGIRDIEEIGKLVPGIRITLGM
jgi:hypothetical protein